MTTDKLDALLAVIESEPEYDFGGSKAIEEIRADLISRGVDVDRVVRA